MKICLINNIYGRYDRGGGSERISEIIVDGLKRNNIETIVISTRPLFYKHTKDENKVEYYIPSLFLVLNKINIFIRIIWHLWDLIDFITAFRVLSILKKEKIEVVLTHNLKGVSFLVPIFLRMANIKQIHTLHDIQLIHPSGLMYVGEEYKIDTFFSKVYQWLCKIIFSSPDIVVSPSKWLLDFHEKRGYFPKSKKLVIPNPVKILDFKNSKLIDIGITKFLYAGQLAYHKGVHLFIDAVKDLDSKNIFLSVYGDGEEGKKLKNSTKDLKNIKFFGKVNNNEVRNRMAETDCVIVPSLCYENSPTVIYEAVSIGIPIFVSDVGGASELVKKFGGILFDPRDKNILKKKILYFIENKKIYKKQANNSKERVKEYSEEMYLKRLLEIIQNKKLSFLK